MINCLNILSFHSSFSPSSVVQFVPLNKFISSGGSAIKSQADLAKEVLAEVPAQLTSFMNSHGFKPQTQPAQALNASTIVPTAPIT